MAREIDREVRRLIDEAHDEALEVLAANRAVLEELAEALLVSETVEGEALTAILDRVVARPSRKIKALMNRRGDAPRERRRRRSAPTGPRRRACGRTAGGAADRLTRAAGSRSGYLRGRMPI